MLYYDRIYLKEGIDPAKNNECNENKQCVVCYYWFFDHGFKY